MLRTARNFALFCAVGMLGQIFLCGQGASEQKPFDVVILHGHIIDGTGSPWYSGDVGIRDGHIAAIGDLSTAQAKKKIDAQGKVVAPGFIDMLGQSELTILVDPRLPSKIFQGITTEITGEGNSVAPVNDAMLAADRAGYAASAASRRIGERCGSILHGWRSRGWASTWRRTWEQRRCGGWCWAMRRWTQRRRSSNR